MTAGFFAAESDHFFIYSQTWPVRHSEDLHRVPKHECDYYRELRPVRPVIKDRDKFLNHRQIDEKHGYRYKGGVDRKFQAEQRGYPRLVDGE